MRRRPGWYGTIGMAVAVVAAAGGLALGPGPGPVQAGTGRGAVGQVARGLPDDIHLNEIQTIGSHNSYHLVPSAPEQALRRTYIGTAEDMMLYQHAPLPEQFGSQKVRQIELDVFLDSAGGRYAEPMLRTAAGVGPYDPAMGQPGIKVLHVQDVDYATTCLSLVACLGQVKAWSDANPTHVPIAILVELKDDPLSFGPLTFTTPEPWTTAGMDTLDAEIRSVFAPGDLITPDDVRGGHATLEEAVLTDGWPSLRESRGKVMFLMDNGGGYRTSYRAGRPSLEGRVLFTSSDPGQPDAAFVKRNDAGDEAEIRDLVAAGYVVRTRADGDTLQARDNDTSTRDAALRSGAQWVSTDYPVPGIAYGFTTDYVAEIPGGTAARCNPVNAPPSCVSSLLEMGDPTAPPVTDPSSTSSSTSTTAPTGPPSTSTSTTSTGPSTTTTLLTPTTGPAGSTTTWWRTTVPPARPATAVGGRPAYTG